MGKKKEENVVESIFTLEDLTEKEKECIYVDGIRRLIAVEKKIFSRCHGEAAREECRKQIKEYERIIRYAESEPV